MSALHEDAQRLAGYAGDELWVGIAVRHLREAGQVSDDTAELVRTQPRGGKGTVAATAPAADAPLFGRLSDGIALRDLRDDLGEKEGHVLVVEGVVLVVSILRVLRFGEDTGIDEHADGDGYVAAVNEVVQDDRAAYLPCGVQIPPSVLEHHQRRRLRGVVPRGHLDPELP